MADPKKEPDLQVVNRIQDLRTAKAEGQITPEQEIELARLTKEVGDERGTKVREDDHSNQSPNT